MVYIVDHGLHIADERPPPRRSARAGRYTPQETLRDRQSSSSSSQTLSVAAPAVETPLNREDLDPVELLQQKAQLCNISDLRISKANFKSMWTTGLMSEFLTKCRRFHRASSQRKALLQEKAALCNISDLRTSKRHFKRMWETGFMSELLSECGASTSTLLVASERVISIIVLFIL
jgi:hypothetical protein